jgi:membrane protein DedA with SNARE-associated domain
VLVEFVGAHPQLSFLAVFLLALSEAVPVVGTVVPGSTLILAVSALATTAGMTPWALLIAAVAGAIVGDGFSFWLGHNYRRQTRTPRFRTIQVPPKGLRVLPGHPDLR